MTESMFFLYFFVFWFTIVWSRYVNLPNRMRKKGESAGDTQESGQMPASANMAMWQTMGD